MKRPVYNLSVQAAYDTKMTPMIDVIFLLLIFFLVSAGFALPESILPTELPATGAIQARPVQSPLDLEPVHIRLAGSGAALHVELNGRPLAGLDELSGQLQRLSRSAAQLPVILDIAPEVLLKHVVRVYDESLAAGFTRIHFAAEKNA